MSRTLSVIYTLFIALALLGSFLFLKATIEESVQRAVELESLNRVTVRLESLVAWTSHLDEGDLHDREVKVASELIDAIHKENKSVGTRLRGELENFIYSQNSISFLQNIAVIKNKTNQELIKKEREFKSTTFYNILIAGVVGYGTIFLVLIFRHYLEKRSNQNNLKTVATKIEQLAMYITEKSNEYEPSEPFEGTMGEIVSHLNAAAKRYEKHRDGNIKILGELLLISAQIGKGHTSGRVIGKSENYLTHGLIGVFNEMIKNVDSTISSVLVALENYQNGDYTYSIEAKEFEGEMLRLIDGVNALGIALRESVAMNHANGVLLNRASNELIGTVELLAKTSAAQAKSVETITHLTGEITQNIKATTEKSEEMSRISIEAKEATAEGVLLSSDTVRAMEEINRSTAQIKEAIAVIDTISFQTNILSLNAAVEAATAGEAGKGFAVVAAEVRTLAGKSAEAARKIKELVSKTEKEANEGMEISKKMIAGFDTLANKVTQTDKLVSEVVVASKDEMKKAIAVADGVEELFAINKQNRLAAAKTEKITNEVSTLATKLVETAKSKRFESK